MNLALNRTAFGVLLVVVFACFVGCEGDNAKALREVKEYNKYNVMKLSSAITTYASRNGFKMPKKKEQLLEFLQSGRVNKNLERLGIDLDNIEAIFTSERDGKPLKVKWGGRMNPNRPKPIVFEEVGVDGVRLVAADRVIEVTTDEEYERLWKGKYKPDDGDDEGYE